MRPVIVLLGSLLCSALLGAADEPAFKPDYRELSLLIQQAVVKQLPKEIEKRTGWNETIPIPPTLRLPRLRTYVRVDDHYEMPHGAWRRVKGHIEDPQKNLQVIVRDFRPLDSSNYRLALDVDTTVSGEGEWQQWSKGLLLFDITGDADAKLRLSLVCDVGVAINLSAFPPEVKLDPKVKELHIDLKKLTFRKLGTRHVHGGEKVKAINEHLEELLREVLRQSEPLLVGYANDAIARGLREGKGQISPAALLKATQGMPAAKKTEPR
jgi:hypothetical protein